MRPRHRTSSIRTRSSSTTRARARSAAASRSRASSGGVTVKGKYTGEGSDDRATFDLETTFAGCHEAAGTLDGNLQWESDASSAGFSASITGELDWTGNNGSASCDFDLSLAVTSTSVSYSGHLCGYDVGTLSITSN
jgi:hypothetical protein